MLILYVNELPEELKRKIQSYLYFSDRVSKHVRIINYTILQYDILLWNEIKQVFQCRLHTLYFRLRRFMDHRQWEEEDLGEVISPNDIETYVQRLFKSWNICKKQGAYNYIMFGSSSSSSS